MMRLKLAAAIALLLPWHAVACGCETVYFLVSDFSGFRASSYVLPLSKEQDKQHARALIEYFKRFKGGPEDPPTPEPGAIVLAAVGWGADGMNRNHLVPGKPAWWWHVTDFLGFHAVSVEIMDGGPETVHLYQIGLGAIGFWAYTVTAELGPALCLCVTREQEALRFRWTDLSTNAAYAGSNYVYTLDVREPPSDSWVAAPGGAWPTRETEWVQPAGEETTIRLYRIRAELLDDRSWQPVDRDCETVFFRIDWVSSGGAGPSSYVLPLSKEEDKRHARALIKHLNETPEDPLPENPGASVIAAVAWGSDGINRNHLLPGKPPWPWHVTEFLGFTPYTGILGTPSRMPEWVDPSIDRINFGAYLIKAELGPALCLSVSRATGALRFQWTDISTNAAYVGTNWVYTVEMCEPPSGTWIPAPGGVWPTRQTEWMQAGGTDPRLLFYRLRAQSL